MAARKPLVLASGQVQNLQDADLADTRGFLGVGAASRSFGVNQGLTPALNAVTPAVYLDRAYTCDGIAAACDSSGSPSGSSATVTLQSSTDGTTYSTLGTVSIAAGSFAGTGSCTAALAAATWVRGKFTAVNAVTGMVATLYLKG